MRHVDAKLGSRPQHANRNRIGEGKNRRDVRRLAQQFERAVIAHFDVIAVAEHEGMPEKRLATLVANLRPEDLNEQESIAYNVAYHLSRGGVLPEPLYRAAVTAFGQHGANELMYLVGLYALVSVTLNAFNVPVPERE